MQIDYARHSGSQAERPKEIDTTSSSTVVYLRKNIEQVEHIDETTGETVTLWEYDEAIVTHAQFEEILSAGISALEGSSEALNDAVDIILSEELPTQSDQISELADSIDDLLTNILPQLMGE